VSFELGFLKTSIITRPPISKVSYLDVQSKVFLSVLLSLP
jgi:hypothetical protein